MLIIMPKTEIWGYGEILEELQKLRDARQEDETRLGGVLSQGVRASRENATPGPGSSKVERAKSPQMQTEGKAESEKKKPLQKQTGGKADLDGPKSSHPPVVGEKGRPLANPPQMQTEGPVKM